MSIIMTPPPIPPETAPDSNVPATLTITYYQQLAAHFSEIIDEIAAIVPRDISFVVRPNLNNVSLKFLGTSVASVEEVAELQKVGALDVNRGRDTLQLLDAFRPVQDKAAAFVKDLGTALNSRQAELASEALDSYDIAKRLARKAKNPALAAWVANLRRDLGRRGPKSKKPAPDTVTVAAEGRNE